MPPQKTTALHEQFDTLQQQEESATVGMWIFLGTEVMLFGGLFLGYAVYRSAYPEAWAAASGHNLLWWATAMTGVLLVSSLTMALAVHAAEEERWSAVTWLLTATIALGLVFLGIKFYEYYDHWTHHLVPGIRFHMKGGEHPHEELFFFFYFIMTLLHATHMVIGVGLVAVTAVLSWMRRLPYHMPVETVGLYWHFVDIIWVFLFPLLYLVG